MVIWIKITHYRLVFTDNGL
uniref:Uncharacterized protein n=1 Tax=Arundo donax TaxID=35708 RepID=A0A0A9ACR9_ARUDO